ncbi:MAG: RtcB family protein [Balneolaceae bacterium]|nr:RtcB family protein [Balneolaceae bacterium]
MEKVISTERLPIKLWLDDMEEGAMEQAKNLANLPFAYKHIAIMPDSHQGYGMPIGGVLATEDAIIPNAVGVDIGCGMCSLRTDRKVVSRDDLKSIMSLIRKTVPVGFNHHDQQQDEKWMPDLNGNLEIVEQEYESARNQVGTLGGGNHFIEIQKGSDGFVWIMIHSGSRNIGFTVAKHHNQKAKDLNKKWKSDTRSDLAFFPADTDEFSDYLSEMNYCIEFALNNRKLMMERVKQAFRDILGDVEFSDFINKPHNFAARENHFGRDLIIHRKGATRAREGELGMIPGSQGTNSYIVKGKGNRDAFESCSHGAGRVMSRNQAKKTLSVEEESKPLEERGILHAIRHKSDLDEAPGSYKDIQKVMDLQKDLIDIVVELEPLAVVKG